MKKNFFLFISSDDSFSFQPQNKTYNFTVELPERINLEGKWVVGLCDFRLTESSSDELYILSDLCEYSYVRDSLQPILRIIYPENTEKNYIFPRIFYIPITNNTFTRINFYIKDKTLRLLMSLVGEIRMTLHFKRRKKNNG